MSQPLNNDFNSAQNSSDSNMQNVNNFDADFQSSQVNDTEKIDDKVQINDTLQTERQDSLPTYNEQTSLAPEVNMPEQNLLILPEERPVSADVSSNEMNANTAGSNLPVDTFKENTANIPLSNEEIQKKIDAVKRFAFCQKGYEKIPVYPYVVALTGHRDAHTESVKETAQKQLHALAQAWDKACDAKALNNYLCNKSCKNNCISKLCDSTRKTAPLIVLIGLNDGKSGKLWSDIAFYLRDIKKFNIKVVAVTSMPLKYLDFSQSDNNIDLNKIDGLIELPVEDDVQCILENIENLGTVCNNNEQQNYDWIKRVLLNNFLLDYQFSEYRKFMCIHSHTLFALADNIESMRNGWNSFNNSINNYIVTTDQIRTPLPDNHNSSFLGNFKSKVETLQLLNELIYKVVEYKRLQNASSEDSQQLQKSFDKLQQTIVGLKEESMVNSRTEKMIRYKLFGNIESRFNPLNESNGISFTSIGPIVCIQTSRENANNKNNSLDNPKYPVSIIVKDQPDDNEFGLTKLINSNSTIDQFPEVKNVLTKLGNLNKCIINNISYIQNSINSGIQTTPADKNPLYQHYLYANALSDNYYSWMKNSTRLSACIGFTALLLFYILLIAVHYNSYTILCGVLFSVFTASFFVSRFYFKSKDFHTYFHYFRALADGLQIQYCWKTVESPEDAAGHYYIHQISDVAWLRAALNSLGVTFYSSSNVETNNDSDNDQQSQLIQLAYDMWDKCFWVKKHWVDAKLVKLTGENKSVKDKFKDRIEYGLNCLSPFGGLLATIVYFLILPSTLQYIFSEASSWLYKTDMFLARSLNYIKMKDGAHFILNWISDKLSCADTLLSSFSFYNYVKSCINCLLSILFHPITYNMFIFAIVLTTVVLMVYNSYRISSLKDLDIKRRRQLLYPFQRARLLLNIYLANMSKAINALKAVKKTDVALITQDIEQDAPNDKQDESNDNANWAIIVNSYNNFLKVLEGLGSIELAISSEWLLGVKKRQFELEIPYKKAFQKFPGKRKGSV